MSVGSGTVESQPLELKNTVCGTRVRCRTVEAPPLEKKRGARRRLGRRKRSLAGAMCASEQVWLEAPRV